MLFFFHGKVGNSPKLLLFWNYIYAVFPVRLGESHQFKDPWQSLITSFSNPIRDRLKIFAIKKLSLRVLLARFNRMTVI